MQRKAGYKRRYGITVEEYEAMYTEQGGVCAVCQLPPKTYRLSVDHNHTTGKARALLCQNCNAALGLLYENTERSYALADYIRQHKERS